MVREQTMSSLQPAANQQEPLQSTGTRPLPPAHPNTSGNAHGQSGSTVRAGEEKQVMRQQMKAEVGDSWWPRAGLGTGAHPGQEVKPAGQGRHRKHWEGAGREGG